MNFAIPETNWRTLRAVSHFWKTGTPPFAETPVAEAEDTNKKPKPCPKDLPKSGCGGGGYKNKIQKPFPEDSPKSEKILDAEVFSLRQSLTRRALA